MPTTKVDITIKGIPDDEYEEQVSIIEEHLEAMGLNVEIGIGEQEG